MGTLRQFIRQAMMEEKMNKADIYIYKVRYDENSNVISEVKIAFASNLAQKLTVERELIVGLLKTGKLSIKTRINKDNKWIVGDDVVLYADEFITTAGNSKRFDNLENLPEF